MCGGLSKWEWIRVRVEHVFVCAVCDSALGVGMEGVCKHRLASTSYMEHPHNAQYKTGNWDWLYPKWSGHFHKVNYLFSDAIHGHTAAFK